MNVYVCVDVCIFSVFLSIRCPIQCGGQSTALKVCIFSLTEEILCS